MIVQVGLGNFGKRHLEAWHRLGACERLWIVEADPTKWQDASRYQISEQRFLPSLDAVLARVQIVDIVTPTESHDALCRRALEAGHERRTEVNSVPAVPL